jgi:hypothetical protein
MPGKSNALHKLELTDGELAAVKGYRADHAEAWANQDKAAAQAVDMAILAKKGSSNAEIARRYKRTSELDVANAVRSTGEILEAYRQGRPPSTWPAKLVTLAELVARPAKRKRKAAKRAGK